MQVVENIKRIAGLSAVSDLEQEIERDRMVAEAIDDWLRQGILQRGMKDGVPVLIIAETGKVLEPGDITMEEVPI